MKHPKYAHWLFEELIQEIRASEETVRKELLEMVRESFGAMIVALFKLLKKATNLARYSFVNRDFLFHTLDYSKDALWMTSELEETLSTMIFA